MNVMSVPVSLRICKPVMWVPLGAAAQLYACGRARAFSSAAARLAAPKALEAATTRVSPATMVTA